MALTKPAPELGLLAETQISERLGMSLPFDASGIAVRDGVYYVVFAGMRRVGRIAGLSPARRRDRLIEPADDGTTEHSGYEDIAYDPATGRFFLLVEPVPQDGTHLARVRQYDSAFRHLSAGWLDFPIDGPDTELTGLTCLRRTGRTYLLALCRGGQEGRAPGDGRVQVFVERRRRWRHTATIRLPHSVPFEDYSSVAVAGDRVAVVSRSTAALWVGTLRGWEITDEGTGFRFPDASYRTVTGAAWLTTGRIVAVSDRVADSRPDTRRATEQSIHLFTLQTR